MKMIDKIKEYIGAQAFSTQDKAELAFRINSVVRTFKRSFSEFKNVPNDQKNLDK
jgi:hypothetical protein